VDELVAWLRPIVLRTAAHTLRNHLATGKRDAGREQPGEGLEDLAGASDSSPSDQAIRHEQTARLAVHLGRLPEDM